MSALGINSEYKKALRQSTPCQIILYNHECYSKFQFYPGHKSAYKCVVMNCVLGVMLNVVVLWEVWLPMIGYQ